MAKIYNLEPEIRKMMKDGVTDKEIIRFVKGTIKKLMRMEEKTLPGEPVCHADGTPIVYGKEV